MVSDLLDISRIEAGKVKLKTEEIEIESLLRSVQKILDRELTAKGISFKYMVEAGIPPLQADEERIRQILLNLIDNSIKYSDPDSSIEIQVLEEQDYVIIKVKDSGWGIPPEDLHHIGKRFYRGRHGSITKGTGLGLALCHEIVEMHGGRMEIESTPGAGTVVRIYLPVRRSDA
jgi:signal transduction histidine kinase